MTQILQRYRLDQIAGAKASTLAALTDISSSQVSKHLSGSEILGWERVRKIDDVLTAMESFQQLAAPIPIDWGNVNAVRECLDSMRDGLLEVRVTKKEVAPTPTGYSIRFSNGRWFLKRRKDGEIVAGLNFIGSARMTAEIADELLRRLDQLGYLGCTKVEQPYGSSPETDFDRVWPDAVVEESHERTRA